MNRKTALEFLEKMDLIEKNIREMRQELTRSLTLKKYCCQHCNLYQTNDSSNFRRHREKCLKKSKIVNNEEEEKHEEFEGLKEVAKKNRTTPK